jgi:uncharacterized membrane protein YsdA (DUF1294 family)
MGLEASLLALWYGACSLICLCLYAWDKRAARLQHRRISERQLLTWALLGGWPGAWWAARWLRHKTQKKPYIWRFYLCVLANLGSLAGLAALYPD